MLFWWSIRSLKPDVSVWNPEYTSEYESEHSCISNPMMNSFQTSLATAWEKHCAALGAPHCITLWPPPCECLEFSMRIIPNIPWSRYVIDIGLTEITRRHFSKESIRYEIFLQVTTVSGCMVYPLCLPSKWRNCTKKNDCQCRDCQSVKPY